MSDILYDAAVEYNKLKNIVYEIRLGRKGCLYVLNLHFPSDAFYHLVGFQHLTDIKFPSTNKERIFKEILSKKVIFDSVKNSIFFENYHIEERITNLYLLETILGSNTTTYLINNKEYAKYTEIKADYLFEYSKNKDLIFYFFSKLIYDNSNMKNKCVGCSFFKKSGMDYTRGTSKTTILMINKFENYAKENQIIELLYKNPSYKE